MRKRAAPRRGHPQWATAPARRAAAWLAAVVVLALGAPGSQGALGGDSALGPAPPPTVPEEADAETPVSGAAAVRDTLVLQVSAAGEALAARQVTLVAALSGRVTHVPARESAAVPRGATLVVMDDADYALAVEDAAARERQARAQYDELTVFDAREPDSAVRAARERAARARSGLDVAAVALRRAQLEASRTRVLAPFEGRIADVKVTPGQVVRPGDELMTLSDLRRIRLDVQVLESDIGAIARGARALVSFAAVADSPVVGRVARTNPLVDRRTRTARVTVVVENPGQRILPGMYARVVLDGERLPGRLLVPRSAVLERDRRTMVFVFRGAGRSGRAVWRYVTTGAASDSLVELLPGPAGDVVRPGEVVLTAGHESLIDGTRVRLDSGTAGRVFR